MTIFEKEEKASINDYDSTASIFRSCFFKIDSPYDMLQWIWVDIAINMGLLDAIISKRVFETYVLTREITLLHDNKKDLLYQYEELIKKGALFKVLSPCFFKALKQSSQSDEYTLPFSLERIRKGHSKDGIILMRRIQLK